MSEADVLTDLLQIPRFDSLLVQRVDQPLPGWVARVTLKSGMSLSALSYDPVLAVEGVLLYWKDRRPSLFAES